MKQFIRSRPASTQKQIAAMKNNFRIYRIRGVLATLSNLYYEAGRSNPELGNAIGAASVAVDKVLQQLTSTEKGKENA